MFPCHRERCSQVVDILSSLNLESATSHQMDDMTQNKHLFWNSAAESWRCVNFFRILPRPFFCKIHDLGTVLEIRMSNELVIHNAIRHTSRHLRGRSCISWSSIPLLHRHGTSLHQLWWSRNKYLWRGRICCCLKGCSLSFCYRWNKRTGSKRCKQHLWKKHWSWLPKRDLFFQRALKWDFLFKKDSKPSRLTELATLRLEKCPSETRDKYYWKFVLGPHCWQVPGLQNNGFFGNIDSFLQFQNLLRKSLDLRFTAIQTQRDMIERFLRVVEWTLQCNLRMSSNCSEVFQSLMDFGNLFDSSISLRNIFRQVASAHEPLFVDAENLVSILLAIDMIHDFVNVVFQIQSVHKLNFEMKTPNIDSAIEVIDETSIRIFFSSEFTSFLTVEIFSIFNRLLLLNCELLHLDFAKLVLFDRGVKFHRSELGIQLRKRLRCNIDASARRFLWESLLLLQLFLVKASLLMESFVILLFVISSDTPGNFGLLSSSVSMLFLSQPLSRRLINETVLATFEVAENQPIPESPCIDTKLCEVRSSSCSLGS